MRRPLAALVLIASVTVARAEPEPVGSWNREDGRGGIRISRCGAALCGFVVWLKDPNGPGHVGERVLYDMRQTAAGTWSGQAHNPEDGRDYSGTMQVEGDRLVTRGCAFGGIICRSVVLLRGR